MSGLKLDGGGRGRVANLLSRRASPAFTGRAGELSDELPLLRKVALPEMSPTDEIVAPAMPPLELPPARARAPRWSA